MKSVHKLAAALAVLIGLLVAAYFILTALQTSLSPAHKSATVMATREGSEEASTPSVASEPITRPPVNQSRLVELTTRPAPTSGDQSAVRTLEVKPAASSEQVGASLPKEPAATLEVVVPASPQTPSLLDAPSTAATSEASSIAPTESSSSSSTTTTITTTTNTNSSSSESPSSSNTAESATPSTSMTITSATDTSAETTPNPVRGETSAETTASVASSESTSSQGAGSSEQAGVWASASTVSSTLQPSARDSEQLYRETTSMPAEGFQMAPEEERAWLEFRRQFGKSYESAEEERRRAEKFVGNLRFINAHNRMEGVLFRLGVNQFADLTRDEINARHIGPLVNWTSTLDASGATRPPQMRILEEEQTAGETAHMLDWRNSTSLAPLDQGACPESALFAVIASLETSLELAGFRGFRLSPRQLMDCLTYSAPPPPAWPPVCLGHLSMVALWEFLQRQSIRLEPEAEYERFRAAQMQGLAGPPTCIPPVERPDTRPKVASYHQVPAEHFEIALENKGPLVVAIDASRPTFHFYKSGIYHELQCSSDVYNMHALLVASRPAVGEPPTGTPAHWTLRASLGPSWGEAGHIHLLKEPARNKCLPEQLATYPDLGFE